MLGLNRLGPGVRRRDSRAWPPRTLEQTLAWALGPFSLSTEV